MIEIELNHRKPRDEERQIVYISVSGVNAYPFKFQVGNVPIELTTDQEVQDHLDSRKDEFHLFCLKATYPGANHCEFKEEGKAELQCFLDWIDAGAENPDGEVITNHLYAGTHPLRYPPSEDVLQEALALLAPFAGQTFEELGDRAQADDDFIKEISLALLALIRLVDHNSP